MAAFKNFVKSFKGLNRKGLRYEASQMDRVWDKTAIVASYKTWIM